MLATGLTCLVIGVLLALAAQGLSAWGRVRGRPLSAGTWLASAAWALLAFAVVLYPAISLGEGELRAALYGTLGGVPLLAVATLILWRFALRR